MLDKECHHDCNQSYCPFAQDAHDANRYVCLKCGVEREIDRYKSSFSSFLLLILGLLISFMLITNYEKQNKSQKQNQSLYNSPKKVYAELHSSQSMLRNHLHIASESYDH
ncbi:MAG: hypothetical protein ACHBN1_33655 [Heteroscytonema crispum UTEX LB 1556]